MHVHTHTHTVAWRGNDGDTPHRAPVCTVFLSLSLTVLLSSLSRLKSLHYLHCEIKLSLVTLFFTEKTPRYLTEVQLVIYISYSSLGVLQA